MTRKSPENKAAEVVKNDLPPAVEQPPEEPSSDRKEVETEVAQSVSGKEEMPEYANPEWVETYNSLKKTLEEKPELQGPMANLILMAVRYGAIGRGYYNKFVPTAFQKSLDDSEHLINEGLGEEDKKRLASGEIDETADVIVDESFEKSSTQTACAILGLKERVNNPAVLAARLKHSNYSFASYEDLRKNGMPKGTVLVASIFNFNPDKVAAKKDYQQVGKNSLQAVFVGLGGTKYRGVDPENPYETRTFDLNDADGPIKPNHFSLAAALVPGSFEATDDATEKLEKPIEETISGVTKIKEILRSGDPAKPEIVAKLADQILSLKNEIEGNKNLNDSQKAEVTKTLQIIVETYSGQEGVQKKLQELRFLEKERIAAQTTEEWDDNMEAQYHNEWENFDKIKYMVKYTKELIELLKS